MTEAASFALSRRSVLTGAVVGSCLTWFLTVFSPGFAIIVVAVVAAGWWALTFQFAKTKPGRLTWTE